MIRPLFIIWNRLKPFEQFAVCTKTVFLTLNRLVPSKVHYMEKKSWNVFTKNLNLFSTEERMTCISWMKKFFLIELLL